jgi:hypothetical protein
MSFFATLAQGGMSLFANVLFLHVNCANEANELARFWGFFPIGLRVCIKK